MSSVFAAPKCEDRERRTDSTRCTTGRHRSKKRDGANETSPSMTPLSVAGASEEDRVGRLTDSLPDLADVPNDIDEKIRGDVELLRDVERQWYDSEENGYFQHEGRYYDDRALAEKEEHLKYRMSQLDIVKRRQRLNLRETLRNADQERWELNRLKQSGLAPSQIAGLSTEMESAETLYYGLPATDEAAEGAAHVLVREVVPPFLDGRVIYTTQQDAVCVVKDQTADLVVLAKRGSAVVRQLRETEERSKMRQRFWEVGGSAMGEAIGVRKTDKTKEQLQEDAEAAELARGGRSEKQSFGKLLSSTASGAESQFARSKTIREQRESLPIFAVRDELLTVVRDHQIVVVVGETGSGKTTQLPQYLYEEGYSNRGVVGCTQPRRVAAISVAKRVADEVGTDLGQRVGYAIRFEDCTSPATQIQYMTDGILLRESLTERDLDKYSVIVMDEAHERSLNTDILFGVLRKVVGRRFDFRLIVTSATMNAEKFADFFGGAPVFEIPGRTFPVRIEYVRSPVEDYVDAAVQKCLQIHCTLAGGAGADSPLTEENKGDILIFMTGQEDIEATCFLVADRAAKLGDRIPPLTVLPIYSTLPADLQAKIFQRSDHRKVIVATNIAETSLTLDGVRYVVDCGYCKLKVYNPKIGMDSLQITPVSQANAQQRTGRAGRTGPGVCYRLFTENAFVSEMFPNTIPEIQRTNLCHTVLLLKSLGIANLLDFEFMDPPPQETIVSSMYQLWVLGALDNLGNLTPTGEQMVQFPLDPPLAKMLLAATDLACTAEVLTVVSMLSVPSIFYRPTDRAEESDAAREKFFVSESDHLTLLNVFQQWIRNACSPQWSEAHFVHQKAMKKVKEVREQILDIMGQRKIAHVSSGTEWDVVRKVVLTTKEYMQTVTAVESTWLAQMGPMFFYLKGSSGSLRDKRAEERLALKAHELEFQAKIDEDRIRQSKLEAQEGQRQRLQFRTAAVGARARVSPPKDSSGSRTRGDNEGPAIKRPKRGTELLGEAVGDGGPDSTTSEVLSSEKASLEENNTAKAWRAAVPKRQRPHALRRDEDAQG